MSHTVRIWDVREFMTRHLVHVFETMLSLKAVLVPRAGAAPFGERLTGSVGFAGEAVTGAVYLHLSPPLAHRVATAMLGLAPEAIIGDSEVNDAVGEVTNMLTGGLKSWICDAGIECATSIPAIIRSTSFNVEPVPDDQRECLIFGCGDDRFVVEIHIKLFSPPRLEPTKILSVDDSRIIRMIIGKVFYHYHVQLCEAADGEEGLAAAAREKPELIILDVTMPVMDGVTMLTKLKEDPALKAIPVIMLTSESGRDHVLQIAKLGVRDYLVKPFKEDQLIEKVGRCVSLRKKPAQAFEIAGSPPWNGNPRDPGAEERLGRLAVP